MEKEQLQRRLMATFLDELEEHVRSLDRHLLALERSPEEARSPLVEALFRTVHSLKGASRSVGAHAIEEACHRLESALADMRAGRRTLDGAFIQLLFTAADALKDAGRRLRAHEPLDDAPIHSLLQRLTTTATLADHVPETAPAGDAVASVAAPPDPESVRVSVQKLDALLARSSELLIARHRMADGLEAVAALRDALRRHRSEWRSVDAPVRKLLTSRSPLLPRPAVERLERLGAHVKRLEHDAELLLSRLAADYRGLAQAASALEEQLLALRLVPFGEACTWLERAVRDLARAAGKPVEFVVEGAQVEISRLVLDRLRDPLLHLLRNAVDHGVEAPDERRAAGKPVPARVTLTVTLRGSTISVVIADDGRGVDLAAVREQARRRQMAVPDDDRDAMRLLFLPGFTTAPLITAISGRGVGLDVVKHEVESLHGHVEIMSSPGRGTRVALTVPLQVATIRALLLTAGGQSFAVPLGNIGQLRRVRPGDLGSAAGRDVLLTDGPPVPVVTLMDVLGIQGTAGTAGTDASGKLAIALIRSGTRQAAFIVDAFETEQELVVKSLGPRLSRVRQFTGAAVLPTGRVALVLNAAELVDRALGLPPRPGLAAERQHTAPKIRRRLLLVEDSLTTRSLEKSILEAAGYDVTAAVDGEEAWRLLQEQGADLVVADVEMPRMDGFALCGVIRSSRRFRDLPVVLVTARESDADKARGLEVGASAYLPKSTFDQRQLLDVIAQLL